MDLERETATKTGIRRTKRRTQNTRITIAVEAGEETDNRGWEKRAARKDKERRKKNKKRRGKKQDRR